MKGGLYERLVSRHFGKGQYCFSEPEGAKGDRDALLSVTGIKGYTEKGLVRINSLFCLNDLSPARREQGKIAPIYPVHLKRSVNNEEGSGAR